MTCSTCLAACVLLSFASFTAAFSADVKVEEKVVGSATEGGMYALAPRGVHVGYAATKGSRLVMTIDGVEGPILDELFVPSGGAFYSGPQMAIVPAPAPGFAANSSVPIIFSANGEHSTYAGRQGNEYVVFLDGKEIARGPRASLALNYGNLTLSPGGTKVFFGEMTHPASGNPTYRTVVNGKPGPWSGNQNMALVFSPDDTHYSYTAVSVGDNNKFSLILDGKDVGYVGMNPLFTADNKLLSVRPNTASAKPALLLDGKVIASGISIDKVVAASTGKRYAAIIRTKIENNFGIPSLFIDGKEVGNSDGARNVVFSPDGKHYAALIVNDTTRSAYLLVDGRKGAEYASVSDSPVWTADGSRILYTVVSGGRNFVIVDEQEFPVELLRGRSGTTPFILSTTGNHYAFATGDGMNRKFAVILDGKSVLPDSYYPVGESLQFNADGSRHAYLVGPVGRSEVNGLVIDGALVPNYAPATFTKTADLPVYAQALLFSPDGKHIANYGRTADQKQFGLFVDGQLAHRTQRGIILPAFTPDSRHLFWTTQETMSDRPQPYSVVYVDGTAALKLSDNVLMTTAGGSEMSADGALTFLGVADGSVKRYRITAPADTTFASAVATTAAADAKLIADAEAAKKAADEKATQAKADKDAAAAKAKADADAAAAAKAQARADALAAKKKAQEDAAAARKAKAGK